MLFDKVLLATLKFSIYGVHILNKLVFIVSKTCIKEPKRSMSQRELLYNLNVPIKAKDPPWFAVQMGSVADSVAAKIRIIIDNTNFLARKISQKWISLTYLYLIMLNHAIKLSFVSKTKRILI